LLFISFLAAALRRGKSVFMFCTTRLWLGFRIDATRESTEKEKVVQAYGILRQGADRNLRTSVFFCGLRAPQSAGADLQVTNSGVPGETPPIRYRSIIPNEIRVLRVVLLDWIRPSMGPLFSLSRRIPQQAWDEIAGARDDIAGDPLNFQTQRSQRALLTVGIVFLFEKACY
jgi:hypothetical protein